MDSFPPLGYGQTAAEMSAGILPTNYSYPELYFERYGGGVSASASANNTAMTNALNVASARGGGILNFPSAGTYSFTNTTAFALPSGLVIQGTGAETILNYSSGTGIFFVVNGSSGGRNEFRDIMLIGPGGGTATSASTNTGTAVVIGQSENPGLVMMRRVTVTGFAVGLNVTAALWARFEMCEFGPQTSTGVYSNNVGVEFTGTPINVVTFSDCLISNNANAGVQGSPTGTMYTIRWRGCTIQNNCQNSTSTPQFYMGGAVQGFEILGLYLTYAYGGTLPPAVRCDNMECGVIADFYIDDCAYGFYDSAGDTMDAVDIIDGFIGGSVTHAIYATGVSGENNVVVRNVNVSSGSVVLTGTGCSYLPLGSGLASWPNTNSSFSPTLSATGGSATYTATGRYSKVGNSVNFNLSIVTSASTLTGPIQVGGLPIALENDHTLSAVFAIECIGVTPSGSNNQFYGELAAGATSITIWGGGTAAPAQVQGSALAQATT
jgi:hypothetical protein